MRRWLAGLTLGLMVFQASAGLAVREPAEPQFTIQIVPRSADKPTSGAPSAKTPPPPPPGAQRPAKPATPPAAKSDTPKSATPKTPATAQPAPKSSPEPSQTSGQPANQPGAASPAQPLPVAQPASPPPAGLSRIEQALGFNRAEQAHKEQLEQALGAVRHIAAQAAGPAAYGPGGFVYVDYGNTPKGQMKAQAEQRRKERVLLLQTLKEHVQQLELQDCQLVETKSMYDYRFIRKANLSLMDAYGVTYSRQDGSGFSFVLQADGNRAVVLQQRRGDKQISEHFNDAIVFHTTITDGMQAFVLKQRLQELINRCKLGDAYRANANLPEEPDASAAPAVRVEGPHRQRKP